jgi:hypothetical protein
MKAHSSSERPVRKPHPDFPPFPHNKTNRWAKTVCGKRHYFGPIVGDEKGSHALKKWRDQKDDLIAGRVPRVKTYGLTVGELCALSVDKNLARNCLHQKNSKKCSSPRRRSGSGPQPS